MKKILFFIFAMLLMCEYCFATYFNSIYIKDPITGTLAKVESNGGLAANIQDQDSEMISYYMTKAISSTTTSVSANIDDTTVTVASVTGASAGKAINIIQDGRFFQSIISGVSGSDVSFNSPLDYAYTSGAVVEFADWNMNVNGSVTTQIFSFVCPAGIEVDITRTLFAIEDDAVMDDGTFGGLAVLSKGIVLRRVNGSTKNIMLITNNGGFREQSFDAEYVDKPPAGTGYAFGCRRSYNGMDKNGVVLRLNGDEGGTLQTIIQDNLSGLIKFVCVVQGHKVTN